MKNGRMEKYMIKRLKLKFMVLTMTALTVLLAAVVTGMNLISYNSLLTEADVTLSLMSKHGGRLPSPEEGGIKPGPFHEHISPELPYESRYFSVVLDVDGNVKFVETGKIASVDRESAVAYAEKVAELGRDSGFADRFRYCVTDEVMGQRIIFLDCGRMLESFYTFLYASVIMAVVGLTAVFITVFFISGRILRPITESYEKQKRFITDAGHEMKTPLTVINANVDLLEMDAQGEELEYLSAVKQQTKRLAALTGDLVMLARMEESTRSPIAIDFPLSEVVSDVASEYKSPMAASGKSYEYRVEPMLTMKGDASSVGKLVSQLLENAVKYSSPNGEVILELTKHGKNAVLTVSNSFDGSLSPDELVHLFDRFYRVDTSRSSDVGGSGIGLSVVKAIVLNHDGKVKAQCPRDGVFAITVSLPMLK